MSAVGVPDVNVGILLDAEGRERIGLEVAGRGRGVVCLTAKGARAVADGLFRAAVLLEQRVAQAGAKP